MHVDRPRLRACALLLGLCACAPDRREAEAELAATLERTNARFDAIDEQLAAFEAKLARLEAKPAPPPPLPARPPAPPSSSAAGDTPPDLEGLRCAGDRCTLKRTLWLEIGLDTAGLAQMARIVPKYEGEQQLGFKLYGIRPHTFIRQLGFKNGDMVTAIDGRPLRSLDELIAAYERSKSASEVVIDFERKYEPRRLSVTIE